MAGENDAIEITVPASADMSSFQYRGVWMRSDGSAGTFAAAFGSASTPCFGVLTNKPAAAGRGARIAIGGVAKLQAGAVIAAGDIVTVPGQAGQGSAIDQNTAGQSWALGIAKSRAAASGDIFEVFVQPFFYARH